MNYRILKSEGNGMESDITKRVNAVLMFLGCAGSIYILLMAWVFFFPPARAERVKIAMHDEQTFQQLRQKHGKVNTGIVVYEADGKAWYWKDGKKISFQ